VIILALTSGLYCEQTDCRFSVPVTVTDAKTLEPLIGFGTDSFQIRVGKQKLAPSEVSHRTIDRVFLFVDASGSMRSGPRRWAIVVQTAYELLSNITNRVPFTTEVFAERGRSFTKRDEAYSYLRYLGENITKTRPLGGRTELYDDIASAVDSEHIGIDDAVIIITDGGDNLSKTDESTLTRELADRAIHPAFLFLTPEPNPQTLVEENARIRIPQIAEELGGFVLYLPSTQPKKPEHILPLRFYAEALAYYRVTFVTSAPRNPQLKVVPLTKPTGKFRKFEVHAPDRLPSCSFEQ
jgi:Mg-chelatase subunit ChlD